MYIFIFLHQTTTLLVRLLGTLRCISLYSYIKPQRRTVLHIAHPCCISLYSYIKPQRYTFRHEIGGSCISLYSYIKPQPLEVLTHCRPVVYLYIPTSNHNHNHVEPLFAELYIFIFLHQTTTIHVVTFTSPGLYIFIFLHQTTTPRGGKLRFLRCISLYSYIKPQLRRSSRFRVHVVYLYIPTSNHNY